MDISSVGSLPSALTQVQAGDAVGIQVLKKAMDIQAASALQLLQGLPQMASNPAHLGNSVDLKA